MTYSIITTSEQSEQINFRKINSSENLCKVSLEYSGRGVEKRWLPRIRRSTTTNASIEKSSELWYIRSSDGGIFQIRSTKFLFENESKINFTGLTFISNHSTKFLRINDYDNTCPEDIFKGMIATFKFK